MHDDITQQLAALSITLSGLKRRLPDAADVHDTLAQLQQRTITLADALRHLSHDLHPGVLQHAGLVAALKDALRRGREPTRHRGHAHRRRRPRGHPAGHCACLYRVAQEALRNIAAHAGARQARVALRRTAGGLELTITDDGQGFDLAEARRKAAWG